MSDAATFRRAADHLEELAARATRGPWRTAEVEGIFYVASDLSGPVTMNNDAPVCTCIDGNGGGGVAIERDEAEGGRDDAAWMVALSPHVAPHLALLFRVAAEDAELIGTDYQMLALARAVLREEAS